MTKIAPSQKRRMRNRQGFVLIAVLVFAITSILYLMAILPLMDTIVRLESFGRSSSELRSAAEGGVDYAMEQLNEFSAKYPSLTCPLINAGVTPLPLPYLKNLPNGTITVDVKSITPTEWGAITNDSTIYNKEIDTKLGPYLVVDSEAKRGLWRSHIRVFLEPTCNVPSKKLGQAGTNDSTASYFQQPLVAKNRIDANHYKTLAIKAASSGNGAPPTFDMRAGSEVTATGAVAIEAKVSPNPTIVPMPNFAPASYLQGAVASSSFDFPPAPAAPTNTKIQTNVANSLSGPYTSSGSNFNDLSAPQVVQQGALEPAKIYIQDDGLSSDTAVQIDARVLKNNTGAPQNMQLWYNGGGSITIDLTSDFVGLIYAPNALVTLRGGGEHIFHGAIVSDRIDLQNSGTMQIETSLLGNSETIRSAGLLYAIDQGGLSARSGYKAVSWQEVSEVP